jgi:mono/diheme cytochrome c family protein
MWKKILGTIVLAVVVIAGGGLAYLFLRKPAMAPPSSVKVETTPARLARGKYLFENLCDCDGCHSMRDFSRFGGPVIAGGKGMGSVFPAELGLPGTVVAPNITPDVETGIGAWTDGEKIRAIREGITRDGRGLFPMMPYPGYRHMSDEDVYSLVAYLNSLAPIRNPLPQTSIKFPVFLFIKGVPQPVSAVVPPPDLSNKVKYGEYLVTLAGCAECHTPFKSGRPVEAMRFGGGREFHMPAGLVISANISSDSKTGIGTWTEKKFVDKFYEYQEYAENGSPKTGPEGFTLMPWLGFSQLPPGDLGAIFAYLQSQPAVSNAVETHPGQPKKAARLDP